MRLVDYLAKGASLGVDRPCLTMDGLHLPVRAGTAAGRRCAGRKDRRYFRQQPVFIRLRAGYFAGGRGVVPESAVRGGGERLSAGAVRLRLHFFPERVWSAGAAELAGAAEGQAHRMTRCRSRERALPAGLAGRPSAAPIEIRPVDDLAAIAGTGGTTGKPKGVMLTGRNIESMTAIIFQPPG
jgi:hypothetical protein